MRDHNKNKPVLILSGEGDFGVFVPFSGPFTKEAIEEKLIKERCHGDRWARAYVYEYTNEFGDVYSDMNSPSDMIHINHE
jgi:hypothetical protein